jgi:hypothetical protein
MTDLLKGFATWYFQTVGNIGKSKQFLEVCAEIVLFGYLEKVVNGGG